MKILNSEILPAEFLREDSVGLITKSLGAACGSERIYGNIDSAPPGAYSTKYHGHSQQEEFFLILSGSGTLRLNDNEYPVKTGEFSEEPCWKLIGIRNPIPPNEHIPSFVILV